MRVSTFPALHRMARVVRCYAPAPEAVRAARQVTVDACRAWLLPERVAAVAELVVSELVGNAVRHARTPIRLTLVRPAGRLHVAVRDGEPALARLPATPAEADARGLRIVDAVAKCWGCTPLSGAGGPVAGKVTWAMLTT